MAKGRKTETPSSSGAESSWSDVVDTVRGLAAVVADHALTELIVDVEGVTFTLRRGPTTSHVQVQAPVPMVQHVAHVAAPVAAHAPAAEAAPAAAPHDNAHVVTSPFVGTFYRRPNPDSTTYVSVNEKVEKGKVLCIVEAMKLMNEIEADIAGTIVAVLAEDGAPVEYGQPLFKIMPA